MKYGHIDGVRKSPNGGGQVAAVEMWGVLQRDMQTTLSKPRALDRLD